MKRTTILVLSASLLLGFSAMAKTSTAQLMPTDTVVKAGRHTVIIKEKPDDIRVILKERTVKGDTIRNEMIFKGVYLKGKSSEQEYSRHVILPKPRFSFIDDEDKPEYMRSDISAGGFSLGAVMLSGDGNEGLNYASSLRYGINLLRLSLPLSRHFVFYPGMNIEFNSIHFKGNQAYQEVDGMSKLVPAPSGVTYETSRLHVTYLSIPIMMRYRFGITSHGPQDFSIDFGPEVKFRTASSSKVWFPDRKKHQKLASDLNLSPVVIDLRLQMNYRGFGLYGTYALTPMFIDAKGPKTNMFSIGGHFSF